MMRMPAPNRRAFERLEAFPACPLTVVQTVHRGVVWPAQSGKALPFRYLKQLFEGIIPVGSAGGIQRNPDLKLEGSERLGIGQKLMSRCIEHPSAVPCADAQGHSVRASEKAKLRLA